MLFLDKLKNYCLNKIIVKLKLSVMQKEEKINQVKALLSELGLSPLDLIDEAQKENCPEFLDVVEKDGYKWMFLHTLNGSNIYMLLPSEPFGELEIQAAEILCESYLGSIPNVATLQLVDDNFDKINKRCTETDMHALEQGHYWAESATIKKAEYFYQEEEAEDHSVKDGNYQGAKHKKQKSKFKRRYSFSKRVGAPYCIPRAVEEYNSGARKYVMCVRSF